MRKYIQLLFTSAIVISLVSCDKFLEPDKENIYSEEVLLARADWVEGLLMRAYINLPNDYNFTNSIATDDGVTNLKDSPYTRMATGEWSSSYYPGSPWTSTYEQIFYINKFLGFYNTVAWATDPRYSKEDNLLRNSLHKKRLKGEAYGLRAWYKFQLLRYHSGKTADGRLLGFPIIDQIIDPADNWKLPRNTFSECVKSIFNDLDTAIANLPAVYLDGTNSIINETSGARFLNRINGNAARALKSRVALLAASPSFSESNAVTWAQAATISGDLASALGALLANGKTFYTTTSNKEIIWNRALVQKRTWEQDNFPPSLFGSGRTNPSQNLVDIFPMRNGYPITDLVNSGYNATNPYANRDIRLGDYVIYNGLTFKGTVINTYIGAASNGIGVLETSTRTGYYLKKFMDPGVNLNPVSPVSTPHTYTLFRETEVLLNYAEAANEAWGPDADPNGYGFTARTKIGDLRNRAGITQPDAYLASITTKDELRTLIRNERRIELCFEGFRFWDIRRWNDVVSMQEPVRAAYITLDGGVYSFDYREIENRVFSSYMIYGPIPYKETLKYNIEQNNGW